MPNVNKKSSAQAMALKYLGHCPLCDSAYDLKNIALFNKTDLVNNVHLECPKCKANFLAVIFFLGQGVSTVGALTDLNFNDIKRIYRMEPIALDEVTSAHEQLFNKKFNNSIFVLEK